MNHILYLDFGFIQILTIYKKSFPIYQRDLNVNADLVPSDDFCGHVYKIRFCEQLYNSPTPKSVFLELLSYIRGNCEA